MLRRRLSDSSAAALLFTLAAASASGALLTDNLGTAKRTSLGKARLNDEAVWQEYGLSESETGVYEGGGKRFTATAWRLKDPTGAQAAFRWLRGKDSKPAAGPLTQYSSFAAKSGDTLLMTYGNYLLRLEGEEPSLDELKILLFQLPHLDQSSLPPLLEYVPAGALVEGSDRFILGPASLEKFYPKLSPSVVAFHFGAEGIVARYRERASEVEMAVFYYPTNPMARDRYPEFQKVSGALVKRTGPLLAIVVAPDNADDAERVLALIDYKATVTISEPVTGKPSQNLGDLLIAIFILIGVILGLCILGGVLVFGVRRLGRKMSGIENEDPMTLLHLEDRRGGPAA
jgi:hypothetical protein